MVLPRPQNPFAPVTARGSIGSGITSTLKNGGKRESNAQKGSEFGRGGGVGWVWGAGGGGGEFFPLIDLSTVFFFPSLSYFILDIFRFFIFVLVASGYFYSPTAPPLFVIFFFRLLFSFFIFSVQYGFCFFFCFFFFFFFLCGKS